MDFTVTCPCGEKYSRNEGAAGSKILCACGKELRLPTFAELRQMSGEPEDPERLIRAGIDDRELFPDRACCNCECRTDDWVPVMIECEPGVTGGFAWGRFLVALFLGLLFAPFGVGLWFLFHLFWNNALVGPHSMERGGKGYRVPLLLCLPCQKSLDKTTLLASLRNVPVYDRLLNKYPDATVAVASR